MPLASDEVGLAAFLLQRCRVRASRDIACTQVTGLDKALYREVLAIKIMDVERFHQPFTAVTIHNDVLRCPRS